MAHLREELGDVLLQVLLHSQIASESNEFTLDDVAKELKEKLIHRHPHVFGTAKINNADDVLKTWDKLQSEEKTERKSAMDGISKSQAALMSAQKISKRAVKQGFECGISFSKFNDIQIGDIIEVSTKEEVERKSL